MSADAKALAAEVVRHLAWLREAGIADVPKLPLSPRPAVATDGMRAGGEGRGEGGDRGERVEPRSASSVRPSTGSGPTDLSTPSVGPSTGSGRTDLPEPAASAVGAAPRYAFTDKGCGSEALLAIREDLGECTRCKLHGGRTTLVFGTGNPDAEVMFVGEGPGADEDLAGEPFVGRAGQLLTKMIEAMGFRREDVYIANVVKCRPPGNRNPEPDEIEACEGFLRRQIAAVRPKVIVALGKFAAQTLLRDGTPITRLRGTWAEYEGVKLMPTFHPAYLLRSPEEKRKAWEDLQLVMKALGKPVPRRTG